MKRLALGTVQFGLDYGVANRHGQVPFAEARAILERARAGGMDTLDTATGYGESEQRLGQLGVEGWQVVSKLPAVPDGCEDVGRWVAQTARESLDRLKLTRLYGLLLHRPHQLLEPGGHRIFAALQHLRADGVVGKIGVSIYAPDELEALAGRYDFDLVQAPVSLVDRRLVESGWLSRLVDRGTELHVRSVFLQGLLLMSPDARPKRFERWRPLWQRWDRWLSDRHADPLEACLGYALSFSEVSRVVVGVDSARHLDEILRVAATKSPAWPADVGSRDVMLLNPRLWPRDQDRRTPS